MNIDGKKWTSEGVNGLKMVLLVNTFLELSNALSSFSLMDYL